MFFVHANGMQIQFLRNCLLERFWNSQGNLWKDKICRKADRGITEAMPENSITRRSITITFSALQSAQQRIHRNASATRHFPDIAKCAVALKELQKKKSEKRLRLMTLMRTVTGRR
jgi:hypothetical protein